MKNLLKKELTTDLTKTDSENISRQLAEGGDNELSLDELDNVSGGFITDGLRASNNVKRIAALYNKKRENGVTQPSEQQEESLQDPCEPTKYGLAFR
jgi:hypothetical protein